MEKVRQSVLVFILMTLLVSCDMSAYHSDEEYQSIRTLFECDVSVRKGASFASGQGSKSLLLLEITNSKILDSEEYFMDFAGSTIPLMAFQNLTEQGIEEFSHIEVTILTPNSEIGEYVYTYPISDLMVVNENFEHLSDLVANEHNMSPLEYMNFFDLDSFGGNAVAFDKSFEILRNKEMEVGGVKSSQIVGFDLVELESSEKGIAFWNKRTYSDNYLVLQYLYKYDSEDPKIIGLETK